MRTELASTTPLGHHVPDVIGSRAQPQVRWPSTWSNITGVTDIHAIRDLPVQSQIDVAMNCPVLVVDVDLPITVRANRARPNPTSIMFNQFRKNTYKRINSFGRSESDRPINRTSGVPTSVMGFAPSVSVLRSVTTFVRAYLHVRGDYLT